MGHVLIFSIAALIVQGESAGQVESKEELAGIHNLIHFSGGLVNGSVPEGDTGFDSLKALGIKTIISVDGAAPDVERARARGIRYVHLPIGYDGIAEEEGLKLAKAVRDLPKPIYIHCFHGVHRSPAAAAHICVSLGQMTPERATTAMRDGGTSRQYKGLYDAVRLASPIEQDKLDALQVDFPSRAKVGSFVGTMSSMARIWDHLKLIREAGWHTAPDHPDISPAHESRMMAERMIALHRADASASRPEEFRRLLLQAGEAAETLALTLARTEPEAHAAEGAFATLREACQSCHQKYRN